MEQQLIKVLVIDDDVDVADVVTVLLDVCGYQVEAALSGREGIEAVSSFKPDVVLLDLDMPEINGVQVAKELAQRRTDSPAKLIAYTGYSCGSMYDAALSAGFHKIICKPVSIDSLIHAINDVHKSSNPTC